MRKLHPELARRVSGIDPRYSRSEVVKMRSVLGQHFELPELKVENDLEIRCGDHVHARIASLFRVKVAKASCACKNLREEMNANGLQWCRSNLNHLADQMLKNWPLISEHVEVNLLSTLARISPDFVKRQAIKHILTESFDAAERDYNRALRTRRSRRIRRGRVHRPVNSPIFPYVFQPIEKPKLSLMFHCYPYGENWKRHAERLSHIVDRFDHLYLGISTDSRTYTRNDVVDVFGPRWDVTHVIDGNLREVDTYALMLPKLGRTSNDVTFCAHSKGSQPHTRNDAVDWWIDAMYTTVLENIDEVVELLNENAIVGSFRRPGDMLRPRYNWHYSGTYYAFRNAALFNNGVPDYRQYWWGTESWPGDHVPYKYSHCIFGDQCDRLYEARNQPRQELEEWKRSRSK